MNDNSQNESEGENLQFDQAEFDEPIATTGPTCGACKQAISQSYYQVNGTILCEPCSMQVNRSLTGGSPFLRLMKASIFGFGAALAGFAIYFGVWKITGLEIGLISILVGFMVGKAVRKGSAGRGGLFYQFLAIGFSYMAIVLSYTAIVIPEFVKQIEAREAEVVAAQTKDPAKPDAKDLAGVQLKPELVQEGRMTFGEMAIGLLFLSGFFVALPITHNLSSPIGLLIIGFALWEAFKINRKAQVNITGPHEVGQGPASAYV